ncbi:mercury methylation corrinoid protein HgcA [Thermodesulfobacteriota bacterium]
MVDLDRQNNECCCADSGNGLSSIQTGLQSLEETIQSEVCCGSPPGPQSSPLEKPGYELLNFVADFKDSPCGPVPRVKTQLAGSDHLGTLIARLGINRDQYKIAPGLYCVGNPDQDSPVLVSANYKLTFDSLRRELTSLDAWLLVLDTRGINVWCAAGKELFSTREVVDRVKQTGLNKVVSHNRLILPQLGATSVSAHQVKKASGFKVIWGPVRAEDIQRFIGADYHTDGAMRKVTFSIWERTVLTPVELSHLPKPTFWVLLAVFLLSGIGTTVFSLHDAWYRGLMAFTAYVAGILAGAVAAPILLPWIPGRAFALKGTITGVVVGIAVVLLFKSDLIWLETMALLLITVAISSYLAMNFTGSTPFTSPSGVEKEMRRAIPLQAGAVVVAVAAWVTAAFV